MNCHCKGLEKSSRPNCSSRLATHCINNSLSSSLSNSVQAMGVSNKACSKDESLSLSHTLPSSRKMPGKKTISRKLLAAEAGRGSHDKVLNNVCLANAVVKSVNNSSLSVSGKSNPPHLDCNVFSSNPRLCFASQI